MNKAQKLIFVSKEFERNSVKKVISKILKFLRITKLIIKLINQRKNKIWREITNIENNSKKISRDKKNYNINKK